MPRTKTTSQEIETLLSGQADAVRDEGTGRVAMRVRGAIASGVRAGSDPQKASGFDWRLWTGAGVALAATIGLAVALGPVAEDAGDSGSGAPVALGTTTTATDPAGEPAVELAAAGDTELGPNLIASLLVTTPKPLRDEAEALGASAAQLTRELLGRALAPARRSAQES